MHDHFADWYRPCTTGTEAKLTEDLLQKRWAVVAKLADESAEHALQFVRIAIQKRSVPADVVSTFRSAFKEADATFQMSGNELELSVLAGSIGCQIMTDENRDADLTALGVICATSVAPGPPWAAPFVACAHSYLNERLRTVRKSEDIRRPQITQNKLKPQIDAYIARIGENTPAATAEAAKAMIESLVQALVSTTETASDAIAELERQSRLRREETDILWWMTTGVSRDLGVPFEDLKTLAATVVAGKELASLVSPPGVLPAYSLLQGMIPPATGKAAGKPIGLIAAVNATDRAWRESVIKALDIDSVADLSPALTAIKQSLTTDKPDGWTAAYKKAAGFKADPLMAPADLALQVHRECILAELANQE
ncbi:MAG: hypothetical protein K2X38_22945 [Gemmataceae bacterium]|nr:hypothetical protein [Gemmataceae bacterium]